MGSVASLLDVARFGLWHCVDDSWLFRVFWHDSETRKLIAVTNQDSDKVFWEKSNRDCGQLVITVSKWKN